MKNEIKNLGRAIITRKKMSTFGSLLIRFPYPRFEGMVVLRKVNFTLEVLKIISIIKR
jgi:hypothetical protein